MQKRKPQTKAKSKAKQTVKPAVKQPAKKQTAKKAVKQPPAKTAKRSTKTISVGRTIKTQDKHLPVQKGGKSKNPKDKRWIAVIDFNANGELAVVSLTTENQPNTSKLSNYRRGNSKTTYFKHFVEIEDNNGNPIKIDGVRFIENAKKYDLNDEQVKQVSDKVLKHSKQSSDNRAKIAKLKQKK